MKTKRCAKCKHTRPLTLSFFHKSARSPDGFHPRCIHCVNAYQNALYPRYRKKKIEYTKEWSAKNKVRQNQNKKRWLNKNQEKHSNSVKAWAKKNPEARKRISHDWAARNPEKIRAKVHKQRARRLNAEGSFTHEDVQQQLTKQNNRCFWCATPLTKYHVDHVIPLAKGGTNYPTNIVCSCPRCNLKKSDKLPDVFLAEIKGMNCADF